MTSSNIIPYRTGHIPDVHQQVIADMTAVQMAIVADAVFTRADDGIVVQVRAATSRDSYAMALTFV